MSGDVAPAHSPGPGPADAPVDVNTADAATLDAVDGLRGHGFEIVRYREERGRFTALRQLDEVPGLSGKVDDACRARLTVGD
jgi:DNA uptake protein ComE-like DNA-binding protein